MAGLDKRLNNKILNVGSGKPVSVKKVITMLTKHAACSPEISWDIHEGGYRKAYLDTSLIRKTLNWTPKVNLDEGLKITWDWFCKNEKTQ